MNKDAELVYGIMLNKFNETHERQVIIRVPVALKEKRRDITDELEAEKLISNVRIYGSDYIECTLIKDGLCTVQEEY